MRSAAFAIPGDINTLTGGYIYERRLLLGLRERGHAVEHIELAPTFPAPRAEDTDAAIEALAAIEPDRPLILDGLVFGALEGLEAVRAPIIAMIHHPLALETGLSADRRAFLFETERRNLERARHVLVPSRHTAAILQDQYAVAPEQITIAPPGTDRPTVSAAPFDPPLILSVGLQHPRKGHDVLMQALAQVTDLPWQAVIVGRVHDAEYAHGLTEMRADLRLEPRVQLAGTVPRIRLDTLYAHATLFALATRYEGYGIVFDEALIHGLPIVSCATGAVPDKVPEAAGLLVPPNDPDAFAASLRRLLTDPNERAMRATAAQAAGAALPGWADTAAIASGVLEALA